MEGISFTLEPGEPYDIGADRAVICRNGIEIIGWLLLAIEDDQAEVLGLWVRADWRERRWPCGNVGVGLAECLIVNAERMLRAEGVRHFEVAGDIGERAAFAALGWRRDGAMMWCGE